MKARIVIFIDLDEAAWNWHLTGEGELPDDRWVSEPEEILRDAVDYASGWWMNTGGIPGHVTYKGQAILIDGLQATSITYEEIE